MTPKVKRLIDGMAQAQKDHGYVDDGSSYASNMGLAFRNGYRAAIQALEAETPAVGEWKGYTDSIYVDLRSKIPDLMRAFPKPPNEQHVYAMLEHIAIWGLLHPCLKSTQPQGITANKQKQEERNDTK